MRGLGVMILLLPLSALGQLDQLHPLDRSSYLPSQFEMEQCSLMAELGYTELRSSTYKGGPDEVEIRHYKLDEKGRLNSLTISERGRSEKDFRQFGYDEEGRITSAAGLGSRGFDVELKYDREGRLVKESDRNEGLYYNAKSRRYSYDRNGHLKKVVESYLSYNLVYKATYKEGNLDKVTIEGNGPAYDRYEKFVEGKSEDYDHEETPKLFGGMTCRYHYREAGTIEKITWTFTGFKEPFRIENFVFDDQGRLEVLEIQGGSEDGVPDDAPQGACHQNTITEYYYYKDNGLLTHVDRTVCEVGKLPYLIVAPYEYFQTGSDEGQKGSDGGEK